MSHESWVNESTGRISGFSHNYNRKNKWIMNTKSFFFQIMGNLGQWRTTKVDKTTKTGYDKAVVWGTIGKGDKEWFTVRVSPFQFIPAWQTSQLLIDTYVKELSLALATDFLLQTGPNHQYTECQRLFTDMSLWALGNSTTGLTQSSLSAVFNGNSRLSAVAVTTFRPPYQVLRGRAWELLINSPRRSLLRSRYSGRHAMLLPN